MPSKKKPAAVKLRNWRVSILRNRAPNISGSLKRPTQRPPRPWLRGPAAWFGAASRLLVEPVLHAPNQIDYSRWEERDDTH
jgi:hypothetical protein